MRRFLKTKELLLVPTEFKRPTSTTPATKTSFTIITLEKIDYTIHNIANNSSMIQVVVVTMNETTKKVFMGLGIEILSKLL